MDTIVLGTVEQVVKTAPVNLYWKDVQVGMLTYRGLVTAMDRRNTTNGAVMVTLPHQTTMQYDDETVIIFGRVA